MRCAVSSLLLALLVACGGSDPAAPGPGDPAPGPPAPGPANPTMAREAETYLGLELPPDAVLSLVIGNERGYIASYDVAEGTDSAFGFIDRQFVELGFPRTETGADARAQHSAEYRGAGDRFSLSVRVRGEGTRVDLERWYGQ